MEIDEDSLSCFDTFMYTVIYVSIFFNYKVIIIILISSTDAIY